MNQSKGVAGFFNKYRHAWVLLYILIYLPWFFYLEKHVTNRFHVIHTRIDDKIPFIEYFIIPYLLWFLFISAVVLYFMITDKQGFYKLTKLLFIGMTIFLIVSTLFPNGQTLRPIVFARDNFCVDLVRALYIADTPTNIFPSIHVFNSLGVCIAISHSEPLKKHTIIVYGSYTLAALIILATMFLKQHSIIDVMGAFVMAYTLYQFVYAPEQRKSPVFSKQPI